MKKALIVGLDNYGTNIQSSFGCINSATLWEYTLKDRFNFDEVKVLTDKEATTQKIKKALNTTVSSLEKEDVFVFIFIGHGYNEDGDDGGGDKKNEKIFTYDGKIIDNEIREILNTNTNNARVVLLVEACYNGTIDKKSNPILITDKANEIVFTACGPSQSAQLSSFGGITMGVFTYYATKILGEAATINYVDFFRKLEFEIKYHSFLQQPQFIYTNPNSIYENVFSSYKTFDAITASYPYIIANPNIRWMTFLHLINGKQLFLDLKKATDFLQIDLDTFNEKATNTKEIKKMIDQINNNQLF